MPTWVLVLLGVLVLGAIVRMVTKNRRSSEISHLDMSGGTPPVPQGPHGQQKLGGPFGRYDGPDNRPAA